MKCILILSAVLALALADTYSDEHDKVDVEPLVTNLDSLKAITACFLDKDKCNEHSAFFKKLLPEAIAEACAKCTPAQKHMFKRYLQEVEKNYPEGAEQLKQKYDPEGKFHDALRAAIADA